jgi:ABC-type Fe3+ transport system permease subunit
MMITNDAVLVFVLMFSAFAWALVLGLEDLME